MREGILAPAGELTLAECLVKPLQTGSGESVQVYEQTIRPRPNLKVVPVSREVLIEAARIRAANAVKLPDAVHLAASRLYRCDAFITNDQRLGGVAGVNCMLLSELAHM